MPTNLTAEAKARWAQAKATKDPKLKVKLLREFYSLMPHHKSTERLEVSIKRQISNLEDEIIAAKARKKGSTKVEWVVRKDIFPQVTLSGPVEHTMKLFKGLTGIDTSFFEIHKIPIVGTYRLGALTLQLILTPYDQGLGRSVQERMLYLIRASDLLLVNLPPDSWDGYWKRFSEWTLNHGLEVSPRQAVVEIKSMPTGGIRLVGKSIHFSEEELTTFLKGYGILNCLTRVSPDATLDDVEAVIFGRTFKKCTFITPAGAPPVENVESASVPFNEIFSFPNKFVDKLLFNMDLLRVYTKASNGIIAQRPLLIKRGSTVIHVAKDIHKDLWRDFKYAKLWRGINKPSIKVGKDFQVADKDIIEIFD